MRELAKLKVLTEGEKQHLHPADAYALPAVPMACPVADGLFSFQQRKEKRKRNAARNRWFLDFLCPVADFRKPLNVALPLRLTRSAACLCQNVEELLLSPLHYRHKASFEPLVQPAVFGHI